MKKIMCVTLIAILLTGCGPSAEQMTATASPTFTPTPLPTFTPTATVTPTVIPTDTPMPKPGDTLLTETFDDNRKLWDDSNTDGASIDMKNGRLIFTVKDKDVYAQSYMHNTYGDIHMTLKATLESGDNNTSMGVACHAQVNEKSLYMFSIYGDGYYSIIKFVKGKLSILVNDTASDAILTGKATNIVEVICASQTLQLIVNHQIVAMVTDGDLLSGQVGFTATTTNVELGPSVVSFDNLTLSVPSPMAQIFVEEKSPLGDWCSYSVGASGFESDEDLTWTITAPTGETNSFLGMLGINQSFLFTAEHVLGNYVIGLKGTQNSAGLVIKWTGKCS